MMNLPKLTLLTLEMLKLLLIVAEELPSKFTAALTQKGLKG